MHVWYRTETNICISTPQHQTDYLKMQSICWSSSIIAAKLKKRRHIVTEYSITEAEQKLHARMATVLPTCVNGMWALETSNPWNLHRSFSPQRWRRAAVLRDSVFSVIFWRSSERNRWMWRRVMTDENGSVNQYFLPGAGEMSLMYVKE